MRRPWSDLIGARLLPARLRAPLYRLFARIPIGPGTGIQSDVYIGGDGLSIGADCFINRFCKFDAGAAITIEDDVFMGFGVLVITSAHEQGPADRRAAHNTYSPVRIGRGSWIGANATILPGVTIGEGCIIAAGSMVTDDTKPNTLYAGVPAVPKRQLT